MSNNIWLSRTEIAALPTTGAAWTKLLAAADGSAGSPSLSNQDSGNNVLIMAKALVYARIGGQKYLTDVLAALRAIATGSLESGSRALALARELPAYVIAADIVDLATADAALDAQFRTKIKALLTFATSGGPKSITESHNVRPNNWGTHAGAARMAVAAYLGDRAELDRAAAVFHGWLGNRAAYAGFTYGDLTWQADKTKPVGVNPVGATIQGHDVSGSLPDDMRRAGAFAWPPGKTDYAWEAMQGAVTQAQLLARAGYPAWDWEDKALKRAANFLYGIGWMPTGDDTWQPWLLNAALGTTYATSDTATTGKNIGWTAWTHAAAGPIIIDPPPIDPPATDDAAKIAAAIIAIKQAQMDVVKLTDSLAKTLAALT